MNPATQRYGSPCIHGHGLLPPGVEGPAVNVRWLRNRGCVACLCRYREENREAVRARNRRYREENREAERARNRRYREENRERFREAERARWRRRSADPYYRAQHNTNRALRKAISGI